MNLTLWFFCFCVVCLAIAGAYVLYLTARNARRWKRFELVSGGERSAMKVLEVGEELMRLPRVSWYEP